VGQANHRLPAESRRQAEDGGFPRPLHARILFYYTYETGEGKAAQLEKEWTNDPLWQNLSVVKNGKAYKVDDVIWNTAGRNERLF